MKRPRPPTGDDSTPAEWIEAAAVHPGYRVIRERMEQMLHKRRAELEQPAGELKTAEIRGRIDELKTVLALPVILTKELS